MITTFFQTSMSPYLNYAMNRYHHKMQTILLHTLKIQVQMKLENDLALNKLVSLDVQLLNKFVSMWYTVIMAINTLVSYCSL